MGKTTYFPHAFLPGFDWLTTFSKQLALGILFLKWFVTFGFVNYREPFPKSIPSASCYEKVSSQSKPKQQKTSF